MATQQVKALADALAAMTAPQATSLSDYLKQTYGIAAPRGHVVVRQPKIDLKADPTENAPSVVDVILTDAGPKKISVIKVVRAATGLGLKEAKDLVDGAPRAVKTSVDRAEAEKVRADLEREGARVELK